MVASAAYGVVSLSCLAASYLAHSKKQRYSRAIGWTLIGVLFVALIYVRLAGVEELFRADLRLLARERGEYAERRDFQIPITAAVIILAMLVLGWLTIDWRRSLGRRDKAFSIAKLGVACMLILISLRNISFSPIDQILYGPFKVNWVADMGSAALVLSGAATYIWIVRKAPRVRRKSK